MSAFAETETEKETSFLGFFGSSEAETNKETTTIILIGSAEFTETDSSAWDEKKIDFCARLFSWNLNEPPFMHEELFDSKEKSYKVLATKTSFETNSVCRRSKICSAYRKKW